MKRNFAQVYCEMLFLLALFTAELNVTAEGLALWLAVYSGRETNEVLTPHKTRRFPGALCCNWNGPGCSKKGTSHGWPQLRHKIMTYSHGHSLHCLLLLNSISLRRITFFLLHHLPFLSYPKDRLN